MPPKERPSDIYRGRGQTSEIVGTRRQSLPETAGRASAEPVDDEVRERQLLGAVREAASKLAELAAETVGAASAGQEQARAAVRDVERSADTERDRQIAIVRNEATHALFQTQARVRELQQRLARGPAVESWQSNAWFAGEQPESLAASPGIRVGELRLVADAGVNEPVTAPLLAPLLNTGNVILVAPEAEQQTIAAAVQGLTLRALSSTGAGQLGVVTFDPRLRGTLAGLRDLRSASTELFPSPASTSAELDQILVGVTQDVARIRELLGGRHQTLGALRHESGQPIEAYELVVLLDFPTNVSQENFDLISRLLERGPSCGTSFVVHIDPTAEMPRDRDYRALLPSAFVLAHEQGKWSTPRLPAFDVTLDPAPPLELTAAVLPQIAAAAKKGAAPSVPFRELVPLDRVQSESSADRITAIIGRAATESVAITLGDDIEQRHNILVAGAVGQGKSNLLLALIHSLAARYDANELEMYLLDFKEGLEFSSLAAAPGRDHWLPQARVLGLESDREFGVAVLGHLLAEFERRAAVIKPHGNNIAKYRAAQPDARMPRIVVVIDEFQVLLAENDDLADRALQSLETLARKGRAYGIHLILASQTLSGIQKLAISEGSIFGQFPTRIALKTSAQESQVVLANLNTEASRLRYRGEAIVNHDFGSVDGNSRVTIAHAEEKDLDRLRELLWRNRPDDNQAPLLFFGNRPSQIQVATGTQSVALVGMPVSVSQKPLGIAFADEPGRHLAIIGDGETRAGEGPHDEYATHMAFGAIHGAARSLAATAPAKPKRFMLLDFLSTEQRDQAHLEALASSLRASSEVDTASGRDATAALAGLRTELDARISSSDGPSIYVVALGLHRAPGLDQPGVDLTPAPIDTLREIVRSGPVKGIHLIAWWGNLRSYTDHINYEVDGMIDGILALKMPAGDASSLFGPFVKWSPQNHRGLLLDKANFSAPRTVVPFAPQSAFAP